MHNDFLELLTKYSEGSEPYALAMIVRREAPSSGKPGDKAIITKKGEVLGWIGGGCTKGIVLKESLAALDDGKSRLVSISPSIDAPETKGIKYYKMTCQSGGSVDVYIEPMTPTTHVMIFGRSHIARALAMLARATGYKVSIIANDADEDMFPDVNSIVKLADYQPQQVGENTAVVVCTQGEDDALSLENAIGTRARYIAFVSSRKKANAIFMGLKKQGVPIEELSKIKTPAGLDIHAKTPEEVAISILAQIIQEKRKASEVEGSTLHSEEYDSVFDQEYYINPVCKIPVQKSAAKHVLEYKGEKVYFCCDGCKESFEKEPEAYLGD